MSPPGRWRTLCVSHARQYVIRGDRVAQHKQRQHTARGCAREESVITARCGMPMPPPNPLSDGDQEGGAGKAIWSGDPNGFNALR